MSESSSRQERFQTAFLLLLVAAISLLFFAMVRSFVVTLLLAAIFSGMSYPLYRRLVRWFRGRKALAAATTIIMFLLILVIPLSLFFGIVAGEAIEVSQSVGPWLEDHASETDEIDRLLEGLPFYSTIEPYQDQITTKIGELASRVGGFVVARLANATRGTVVFLFMLFVMLYSMFFFLRDGKRMLHKILYYMPLQPKEEELLVSRFVSVARATIKGTLIIGVVQGGLAGLGFLVVGIPGVAFWSLIMAVLSIIPGIGTGLVWVPAAIYLAAIGKLGAAIGLTIWCAAVVGSVDNVLRPWLVGKDTQMSDLLILLGTLGGLLLFGAVGIIIGPIVAALFVTVWEIYGETFKDVLPEPTAIADLDLEFNPAEGE
jgi:predicted PurR-regulated permease PerM